MSSENYASSKCLLSILRNIKIAEILYSIFFVVISKIFKMLLISTAESFYENVSSTLRTVVILGMGLIDL